MKRWWPVCLVALLFLAGAWLRYEYIFHWHPANANEYLTRIMKAYYNAAVHFGDATYQPSIVDTLIPPGAGYFFGILLKLDPSLKLTLFAQFVLSISVPLLLGAIGYDLFGRRVALCVLGLASLYFYFIDYAGYYLAEGPFIFLLLAAFALLVRCLRTRGVYSALFGFFAGVVLGLAAACKSVALAAGLAVLLGLLLLAWQYRLRLWQPVVLPLLGLLLVLVPLSVRATQLNGGFCLIANDWARYVLIGHRGEISEVEFNDGLRGRKQSFGSAAAYQKGFRSRMVLPVGAYENRELLAAACAWMAQHPLENLLRSTEHVFDLFFNNLPWLSVDLPAVRPWLEFFQKLFFVFILLPAAMFVYLNAKNFLQPNFMGELLVLLPVLAIMLVAFVFVGEARYRIPFDGFLMLLAARQYCGTNSEPQVSTAFETGLHG